VALAWGLAANVVCEYASIAIAISPLEKPLVENICARERARV
jgi:hypothetical protein